MRTTSLLLAAAGLAVASMLGSVHSAAAQSAVFEQPVKSEPGNPWWDTDPAAYHEFSRLADTDPDVRLDGPTENAKTITVSKDQVVELDFPLMYEEMQSGERWALMSATGAHVGFYVVDFHVHFKNGQALIHEPGTMLWKFRAKETGDLVLVFRHGKPVVPNFTAEQPGDVRITIHVE